MTPLALILALDAVIFVGLVGIGILVDRWTR